MTCDQVEPLLAAYADGAADRRDAIAAHVAICESCARAAQVQATARAVLRARAAELSPVAPPGLHTRLRWLANDPASAEQARLRSLTADQAAARGDLLGWSGRLTAFAAAAVVVMTLGAILLPAATIRSTALLAAQLALDHLKCFTIEGDADGAPISKAQAETTLKQEYDLAVSVPASMPDERLELMAVRRCLYGDGRAAHLMYRLDGEPVSLFVIPGLSRPADEMSLFGHEQTVWTGGDRTYMLVARAGLGDRLARVATRLRNEAK